MHVPRKVCLRLPSHCFPSKRAGGSCEEPTSSVLRPLIVQRPRNQALSHLATPKLPKGRALSAQRPGFVRSFASLFPQTWPQNDETCPLQAREVSKLAAGRQWTGIQMHFSASTEINHVRAAPRPRAHCFRALLFLPAPLSAASRGALRAN